MFDPQVEATLSRLHASAGGDWRRVPVALVRDTMTRLSGRFGHAAMSANWRDVFIPLGPDAGRFVHNLVVTRQAKVVVEFGTSMGVSTIYLASALKRLGEGVVIGTELDAEKAAMAQRHFEEAGVEAFVDLRVGDARETLKALPGPVDLVLLDGWKDLYLDILLQLEPHLAPRAVVLADNVHIFRLALGEFLAHMHDPASGYDAVTLSLGTGLLYAVKGDSAA